MEFTFQTLREQAAAGADSSRQFKSRVDNADSLAAEMAAFANADGGTIFIGIQDDGAIAGIAPEEVRAANQLISNAASQHVRSPLAVRTQNILLENGNIVIALTVPKGLDKPYFDRKGVIWIKTGPDKRRVNSKEELRRLFQHTSQFHADELPTKADPDKLDQLLFRDFLRREYEWEFPESYPEQLRLLRNLNLAANSGKLNLAGVLLFAERPGLILPEFIVKGARFPGTAFTGDHYKDSEDFEGPLSRLFGNALAFIMRNLHKIQAGNGVNSPGSPEIPKQVFEELLVNALIHRDYLISAPIRILIFDDRIEIISPGTLPNNLTVANIRTGNSIIRNPILISFAAKGLLPYHGIGSGIPRALAAWPHIRLEDDREKSQFRAIVRKLPDYPDLRQKTGRIGANDTDFAPKKPDLHQKTGEYGANEGDIAPKLAPIIAPNLAPELTGLFELIAADPRVTIDRLAQQLQVGRRTVINRIGRLKELGLVSRSGPNRGGCWIVNRRAGLPGDM